MYCIQNVEKIQKYNLISIRYHIEGGKSFMGENMLKPNPSLFFVSLTAIMAHYSNCVFDIYMYMSPSVRILNSTNICIRILKIQTFCMQIYKELTVLMYLLV